MDKSIDAWTEVIKELTAATSAQHRDNLTIIQRNLRWSTVRRTPKKHFSTIKSVHSLSICPTRAKKPVFSHCEVEEDKPSDLEDQMEDGGEFESTEKQCIDSKSTSRSNGFSESFPSQPPISVIHKYGE